MTADAQYLAGRIEHLLATDARTNELGIRAEVLHGVVYLRGEVVGEQRRELAAEVAREAAPGLLIRNEVTVARVRPASGAEVVP